jgi:HAMP domain-containing protein
MRAWLKNAVEVVLWYWIGRPTSKMERRYAENAEKLGPHPKPGRVYF